MSLQNREGRGVPGTLSGPLTWQHDDLIHVAKDPVLPRFEGLDQGMLRSVEVLGRVTIGVLIAATHVPTHEALPEMYPGVAGT